MISNEDLNNLSEIDRNIILSLWHCPYDHTLLEKVTGPSAGELEVRRGPKTNVALKNAVNMRRIDEKEINNSKAVFDLTFQILPGEYRTYSHVICPKKDYKGYAPKLQFQLSSTDHHEALIKKLLDDSSKYFQKAGNTGRSGRRFPIFGIFILLWLIPIIALGTFLGWAVLYSIFAF